LKRLSKFGNNVNLLVPVMLKQYFSPPSVMVKGLIIMRDIIIEFLVLHINRSCLHYSVVCFLSSHHIHFTCLNWQR